MPFLGPALGLTAMCSPGWGNLVAIDWNDLPAGREFDGKFLKNVKSSSTLKNAGGKERRAELRRSARRQQFIITVSSWRFYNWQEEVLDQKSPKVVDRVVSIILPLMTRVKQ